jgi:hypothetical protein
MSSSFRRLAVLGLLGLSVLLVGQVGTCGFSASDNGSDAGTGDDPLAPLVGDDPLAPLVARGACALWVGTLTGERHGVTTRHYECPWQSGGHSTTDENEDETHTSNIHLTFSDVWVTSGSGCAPAGAGSKAVSCSGSVTHRRSWSENYDYGDSCGRYHTQTVDEAFTYPVQADDVQATISIDAGTYSEQQAILAERPCRSEYPVRVQIQFSVPASGGGGVRTTTDTSKPCNAGATTTSDTKPMTEDFGAAYIAIVYGTYYVDANGSDRIEARVNVPLPAVAPSVACSGVNSSCTSACTDALAEEYTLTLTRFPEGDRDSDGECDSVDPCPDAAFENECE